MWNLVRMFRRDRRIGEAAWRLYAAAVAQGRRPEFFLSCGVPDSLDGRFETLSLHVFLLLRRLKREGRPEAERLAQALFDAMFANMDESLREMGVGDLSVGPKVKRMAQALYGRMAAYEAGLTADEGALAAALRRNLYGTAEPDAAAVAAVAAYLRREDRNLAGLGAVDLMAGRVAFGPPPVSE